jgi:hypothetical protein
MRQGISMGEIDRMDLLRYLDVLAREIEHGDAQQNIGVLPQGTIEDILG